MGEDSKCKGLLPSKIQALKCPQLSVTLGLGCSRPRRPALDRGTVGEAQATDTGWNHYNSNVLTEGSPVFGLSHCSDKHSAYYPAFSNLLSHQILRYVLRV